MTEPEKTSRKIGLYGPLDDEKGELVVYSFVHLHETRMKSVPRPLTAVQKKKLKKAIEGNDENAAIDVKLMKFHSQFSSLFYLSYTTFVLGSASSD
jgi:hypothetical protein